MTKEPPYHLFITLPLNKALAAEDYFWGKFQRHYDTRRTGDWQEPYQNLIFEFKTKQECDDALKVVKEARDQLGVVEIVMV